jgi:cytochrome c peroxidase
VLSLGPWPPPRRADPSNRVSGLPQAIELGRRLFRDPRMSSVGYVACVTCHQPDRAFTDTKARAHGLADLPRNTPALFNLWQQRWFGWGGSSDSLWMASIRPILDPRELDGSLATITRLFARDAELAACYRRVFGVSPLRQPERTAVNVGKALAAFQETLVTGRTPFDEFRDALARGDVAAAAAYPAEARRGLRLFVGAAGCAGCHGGPNLSDGEFHATGAPGVEDDGRFDGASSLKRSPLNLSGRFNDDATGRSAIATRHLVVDAKARGRFRTPSLRNVAVTAPYLHDGRVDALTQAVQHVVASSPGGPPPDGGSLNAQQVADLSAFLQTLTDREGERRPWSSADRLTRCP